MKFNPNNAGVDSGLRSWREATQTIRAAAARLAAEDQAQSDPQAAKPPVSVPAGSAKSKAPAFGAARLVEENILAESIAGVNICSAAYMSPERCRGQRADARSDLYSLTCRYYELLTGEHPFNTDDVATLLYEHCYTPFPDAGSKVPGLPEEVRLVFARGSEKEPACRYQSAAEMVADLTTLLAMSEPPDRSGAAHRLYAGMPVGSGPISLGETRVGSSGKYKIAYALLALVTVGSVTAWFKFRATSNPAEAAPEPANVIADTPRYLTPTPPAATQVAVTTDLARPTTSISSIAEKVIPELPDVAAYVRGLGITDKPILERGVLLRGFDFTRPIPTSEWPTLLAQMNDVEFVLFHQQSGTDEAVRQMAKLPMLQRLSLGGEPVTDKGCAFLNGHPTLQRLDLANTAITGAAIADIASIPHLTALDLRKTAVQGDCWKPLRQSRVSSLWIGDNAIEDQDLADLAAHPFLSMIQLSNTRVTDAVIDTLASMPNFRQGDFAQTRVDEAGVAKLCQVKNLVTLELSGCPIAESGLAPLANLKKLRRLVIRDLTLSDSALDGIAGCAQLEGLDLGGCHFNAAGLGALSRLSALRSLRIGGARIARTNGSLTSQRMLDDLKRELPNLRVEGVPQETPE